MSPWGWHLLSLLRHIAVAALLGLLVWILLRDRAAVLLAAGLFALHPSHTESVAWVTVPDPLMSLAILISVILFLIYLSNDSLLDAKVERAAGGYSRKKKPVTPTRPILWFLGSAVACLTALLLKETAVMVPAILLVVAVFMSDSLTAESVATHRSFRHRLLQGLRLIVPFVCVTLVYFLMRFHALGGKLWWALYLLPQCNRGL